MSVVVAFVISKNEYSFCGSLSLSSLFNLIFLSTALLLPFLLKFNMSRDLFSRPFSSFQCKCGLWVHINVCFQRK